ncbi:MAG: hypothetical protein MJZ34_12575, partial [Paludibacteraceae bacterium]|nr:hypothetical protein [Paludibacteraceae bacterium]
MATSVCEAVDEEGIPHLVGDGSTENPYQIKNADDLYWFAEHVSQSGNDSSCAILTTDIVVNANVLKKNGELNGDSSDFKTWTPIGTLEQPFTGVFDGAGHTISGLYVDGAEY